MQSVIKEVRIIVELVPESDAIFCHDGFLHKISQSAQNFQEMGWLILPGKKTVNSSVHQESVCHSCNGMIV